MKEPMVAQEARNSVTEKRARRVRGAISLDYLGRWCIAALSLEAGCRGATRMLDEYSIGVVSGPRSGGSGDDVCLRRSPTLACVEYSREAAAAAWSRTAVVCCAGPEGNV